MTTSFLPSLPPHVFTIPSHVPFIDALAEGLRARFGDTPLALAEVTVLLPTRRAGRALREAFLRQSEGRPLLLPRMMTLGDLDADFLDLAQGGMPDMCDDFALPEAIRPLRRQLLLTRLIRARGDSKATLAQAVQLAGELARLLDQVQIQGIDFARLAYLVPEEYARHWQITLDFLRIVTEHWPHILAAEGVIDAADRRNRLLAAQAALWQTHPPATPILAAGSTGSVPASAALLATIARLDKGIVVLPGLDQTLDDPAWEALDESHPQFNMGRLVQRMGIARTAVPVWHGSRPVTSAARLHLLSEVMRPASTTDVWRDLPALPDAAVTGLTRIDCPGPQEEATVIALRLRQALETSGHTASLVTPDRPLARRVAAVLQRWGVVVDDSGGQPLADSAVGTFLRLVADMGLSQAAPLPLLALLKHPLAAGGETVAGFRARVRALERAVLRGPRPGEGFAGLVAALHMAEAKRFATPEQRTELLEWLETLRHQATPFLAALESPDISIVALLRAHIGFAEALAACQDADARTSTEDVGDARLMADPIVGMADPAAAGSRPARSGAAMLWRNEDGETAASFIAELHQSAHDFPPIAGADYPALFQALMRGRAVRPRYGQHPRLTVLGPLEARLQHADTVILGGLNEGIWPADPRMDPWMSRPMRAAFGLLAPEHHTGLSAHDFVQAAGAATVVLTRAERVEGTPTVPSRWLSRLDTVLRATGLDKRIGEEAGLWLAWAAALDTPEAVRPVAPPAPRPPLAVRPRRLSVTEIELWMRDPYSIYARHILKLIPLDPIAADPGAAERGQFIHQALDQFVCCYPGAVLPPEAETMLLQLGQAAFGDTLARPDVWAFWWPRFARIATWFVAHERKRRQQTLPLATEVSGSVAFEGREAEFILSAKADRIDRLADGRVALIDYKTGAVPRLLEIEHGFAPQLPLEAVIAVCGGFRNVRRADVGELAFWRLSGGDPPGEERPLREKDIAALAESAHRGLENLIWTFDDPATPYRSQPRPDHAPRFAEYTHLARVAEWSAEGGHREG